jgi:hypothetical protein
MKRGRKTLLTAALRKRIFGMLRRGHTVRITAGTLGFSERVFFEWCQKDCSFAAASLRARAAGRVRIVDSILADKDWRSKAWYLERTASDEFARTEPRTVVIERPPPTPSPEPEASPPKGMERFEKWFTPNGEGIPLDRASLDYLATLRRHSDPSSSPRSENGEEEAI